MSVLSDLEVKLGIVETDVVSFFSVTLPKLETWVEAEVQAIAGEFDNAIQWLAAHGQEIAADVAGVIGIVSAVAGAPVPAAVVAAQAALNLAVGAVNAAVAKQQASAAAGGTNLDQAIAAGGAAYQALKSAQASTAVAQSQVAVAPPVVAAP